MTETPEQLRARAEQIDTKFFDDFEKRGGAFGDRSFDFEKLAVDCSHKGFQTLTYLNGGALVAIPTAMAFFKADVSTGNVLLTAAAFILGLLLVVLSQGAAFFTMATRAEGQELFAWEQFNRIAALQFPQGTPTNVDRTRMAQQNRDAAAGRNRRSNVWRYGGLFCFGLSLLAFVAGCSWGAITVMTAKQKVETSRERG